MNAKNIKNNEIHIWQKNIYNDKENTNKYEEYTNDKFLNSIKDNVGNCINIQPTHLQNYKYSYIQISNRKFNLINKKKFNLYATINSFFCIKITNELIVLIKNATYNVLKKKLQKKNIKIGIIKKIIFKTLIIFHFENDKLINLLNYSKNNIYKYYLINSPEYKCIYTELIIRKIFKKSLLKTIVSSIIFFNNNHFIILILIKEKNKYKYKKLLNNYNNFIVINLIINKIINKFINNKINLIILPLKKRMPYKKLILFNTN